MKLIKQSQTNDSEINSPRQQRKFEESYDKKYFDIMYEQQTSLIETTMSNIPREQFICHCKICLIKQEQLKKPQELKYNLKIRLHPTQEKDFVFVLKRLLPTHRNTRSLNLNVPDTVCFIQGEPSFILYNQINQIKVIRDKLSLNQIRQFMNQRRQKLTGETGRTKQSNQQRKPNLDMDKTREAVIVRYDDDNSHIMTEVEFLNLMMKRKGDPFWLKVQFVQNWVKSKYFKVFIIKYEREVEAQSNLFIRGSIEARQLSGDLVKGCSEYIQQGIEEEYQNKLKIQNLDSYLRYMTYKVIWYMEVFYGARVDGGQFEWLQDEKGEYYLMNAYNVSSTDTEVNFRSEDWFYQDVEKRAHEKLKLRAGMISDSKNEKCQEWEREMGQHFEYMQRSVGIDENSFKITIDNRSDNVFRTLHPKCKYPFRKIIESQSLYNKMKKDLLQEKKHKPMLESKMLNTFFLSPEKNHSMDRDRKCQTSFIERKQLMTSLNLSRYGQGNRRSVRSTDRTWSSFKSRSSQRPHNLNNLLGIL